MIVAIRKNVITSMEDEFGECDRGFHCACYNETGECCHCSVGIGHAEGDWQLVDYEESD